MGQKPAPGRWKRSKPNKKKIIEYPKPVSKKTPNPYIIHTMCEEPRFTEIIKPDPQDPDHLPFMCELVSTPNIPNNPINVEPEWECEEIFTDLPRDIEVNSEQNEQMIDVCAGAIVPPSFLLEGLEVEIKDLIRDAIPQYWDMVNRIYNCRAFRSEIIINYLISRYIKFLDLVAESSEELIPPFEIEAIWLSHGIRTQKYREDCNNLYGKMLHRRINLDRYDLKNPGYERAVIMWFVKYHDDIALDMSNLEKLEEIAKQNDLQKIESIQLKASDVIKDNGWVRDFNKVYDFERDGFICSSMGDYLRYMYLSYKYKGTSKIFASQKVDISWHCHMLNTNEYSNFCLKVFGGHVDHSPWPIINNESEIHNENKRIWREEYGVEYE